MLGKTLGCVTLLTVLIASAQFATLQAFEVRDTAQRTKPSALGKPCIKRQSLGPAKFVDDREIVPTDQLPFEQSQSSEAAPGKTSDHLRNLMRSIHIGADGTTEMVEPCEVSEADLKKIVRRNAGSHRQGRGYTSHSFHVPRIIDLR